MILSLSLFEPVGLRYSIVKLYDLHSEVHGLCSLTIPLGVKTRSAVHQKKLSLHKGVPYLTLHKHRVPEKIMYTSELSIYHTSYLFIQRIVLFRSSFICASCALVFNFVINFSHSKNHSKKSRFNFHAFHLIHQFCTFI